MLDCHMPDHYGFVSRSRSQLN